MKKTAKGLFHSIMPLSMLSAALGFLFGPATETQLVGSAALCAEDGGTCCGILQQQTCYPNGCSESSCSVPAAYWYTLGDKCPPEPEE